MDAVSTILLIILYPSLMLARMMNALLGRDRLRLGRPPTAVSCWIERREPDHHSYFSETSTSEGYPWGSAAQPIAWILRRLSRIHAPKPRKEEISFTPVVDRDQGIPDEIYTLW